MLFTTATVGCVAKAVMPELPWAACFALGAIVSPPDAVAAKAVQARSKPLLDDLQTWMEAQRRRAWGKTALGKALRYALTRWEALTRYADD